MNIEPEIPELESILHPWKSLIGDDYSGYRNHVYRMLHCAFALHACDQSERRKLIIAGAFHDIGIWTEGTIDYIEPSITPAMAFLEKAGLANWTEEISLMISEHHKLTAYTDKRFPLVELFRKADLVDFSLGSIRFGLPKSDLATLAEVFPNSGFHGGLVKKAGAWILKHPLNPAPMMKW